MANICLPKDYLRDVEDAIKDWQRARNPEGFHFSSLAMSGPDPAGDITLIGVPDPVLPILKGRNIPFRVA